MYVNRPTSRWDSSLAVDDLYLTTYANRRPGIVDVVFHKDPFGFWLSSQGRMWGLDGGTDILIDLEVGENNSVKSFGSGATFSKENTEILSQARYPWKQIGGSLTRDGLDDAKNTGVNMIRNLVNVHLNNLEKTLRKQLSRQLVGDGTGNGGLDIDGIQSLINPTGIGTVGGINSTTYSWWRNQVVSAAGRSMSVYLLADLRTLYLNIGADEMEFPDFHITTQSVYQYYDDECLEQKQIVNQTMADAEFEHLIYCGKPVVYSSQVPAGYWYMINSEYIKFAYNKNMNFKATDWKVEANGLDRMMQITTMCNLVSTNRMKSGVVTGLTTA